ncbi:34854_t:CDS:1, partial [Racocetra persica]
MKKLNYRTRRKEVVAYPRAKDRKLQSLYQFQDKHLQIKQTRSNEGKATNKLNNKIDNDNDDQKKYDDAQIKKEY